MNVLSEVLVLSDRLRGLALESFGPFAGIVVTAGQVFAGVLALLLIAAGRGLWAPSVPNLRNFAARMAGLVGLLGVLALYLASRDPNSPVSFLLVATCATGALLVFGLLYMVTSERLIFRCEDDPTIYIRGLWLNAEAQAVLKGNPAGMTLPDYRSLQGGPTPKSDKDYFCGADRDDPGYVWTATSLALGRVLLVVLYLAFAVSMITLLASAALAVQQADTRVVETPSATIANAPTDLLFGFDSAELRPEADDTLSRIAGLIRQRWISGPVAIVGHTDAKGAADHNLDLSRRRAAAVVRWLQTEGGLAKVPFDAQGRGASEPVAPNTLPDGADNPDGRTRNRRVVVDVPKPKGP